MKFHHATFTAIFAMLLVSGAATLTYYAYSTKTGGAQARASVFITLDPSTPASDIVVAGKSTWVPFTRYKVSSSSDNVKIDKIAVNSLKGGDAANFVEIGIASGGVIKGTGLMASGKTSTDIDLSDPIIVNQGATVDFEIWAKLSDVQASALVSNKWTNVSRSGHTPGLAIASNITTGAWNVYYKNNLNVNITSVGNPAYHFYAMTGPLPGKSMVLRKSKPIVAKLPVGNTNLTGSLIEREIYRFQVGADSAGPIAIKQMAFRVAFKSVEIGNFRLYRGAFQVPTSEYSITDASNGKDLKTTMTSSTASLIAVVAFTGEDVVLGSGYVYSLRALTKSSTIGGSLSTGFYTDPKSPIITGSLTESARTTMSTGIKKIYGVTDSRTNISYSGTFVWSDNSEVPHSSIKPSSIDWTNDTYVKDLSSMTVLSN